jgi:hypothetical protein
MRTKKERVITEIYTEYKCDFCEYTTDKLYSNYQMFKCALCGKDCCKDHSKLFMENPFNWDSYPELITCLGCAAKGDELFDMALECAGRNDYLPDVIERCAKELGLCLV